MPKTKTLKRNVSNSKAQSTRIDLRQAIDFHPASYIEGSLAVGRIFRKYKRITGGADGSVTGLNGSIRPLDLVRILGALEIQGREFQVIDFGAGDGRVLVSAIVQPIIVGSATKATGYELPDNRKHRTK